jgi:nuclear pore complex protein Nup98-Nup96
VNPIFGAAKPAAGFGAFGGTTNAFGGGGGAFGGGNTTTTTSAFGQPANNTTSAFGQPANPMFGKPATAAFGTPAAGTHSLVSAFAVAHSTLANNAMENVPAVSTGSSNPPYAPFSEKDPAQASVTNNYQSISCMPAYRGTSFEVCGFYHL